MKKYSQKSNFSSVYCQPAQNQHKPPTVGLFYNDFGWDRGVKESNKPENTFVATDFSLQHTFDRYFNFDVFKSKSRCFQVEPVKILVNLKI